MLHEPFCNHLHMAGTGFCLLLLWVFQIIGSTREHREQGGFIHSVFSIYVRYYEQVHVCIYVFNLIFYICVCVCVYETLGFKLIWQRRMASGVL